MRCFQRNDGEPVPGVNIPEGYPKDHDICAYMSPMRLPNKHNQAFDLGNDGCSKEVPCEIGYGDCDNDDECRGNLKCCQRDNGESCLGLEIPASFDKDHDFCYDPKGVKNENFGFDRKF